MFNFLGMVGNYEQRKVGRYEKGELLVSTAEVNDSKSPYETAVAHPKYNSGKIVIVEMYDSMAMALRGHKKWVSKMKSKTLPKKLVDVSTSEVALLAKMFK